MRKIADIIYEQTQCKYRCKYLQVIDVACAFDLNATARNLLIQGLSFWTDN